MSFMLLPMIANAAPAVKLLGNNNPSVAGTKTVVPAKVTPARAAALAKTGNAARVGTLRAKSATTNAGTGSTARFPVIIPTKVYTTSNAPKATGGGTTIVPADTSAIEGKLDDLTDRIGDLENTVNVTHNTQINNNTNNIRQINTDLGDDPRFDSVVVGEEHLHTRQGLPEHRAWMWIELPE